MLNNITIPDEVVKAATSAYNCASTTSAYNCASTTSAYNYASTDCYSTQEQDMTAAILAALKAWPGMWVEQLYPLPVRTYGAILPLPQEKPDDQ